MKRAIFLRELRVGLRQELVVAGVVLGVLAAAGWLAVAVFNKTDNEVKGALWLFLTVTIAPLAFSSGARAFTAEARQHQEMFFYVLPVSRGALWFSMVGGRLTASLPVAVLLFIALFLLPGSPLDLPGLGVGGLALYAVLFSSGCCLSLLFRRNTIAYLAGLLIVSPVLFQVVVLIMGFSEHLPGLLWVVSACLLSAAFLLLSWFFFQRGELQVRTRQLTHLMLLGVTLALILLLIGIVTQSPILDRFAGPWTQDLDSQTPFFNWRTFPAPPVSPGGRYLAFVETLRARPGISRVTIVETATGRRISQYRWRGIGWVSWDARSEFLRILCRDREIPFFWRVSGINTTSDWISLTPEGRELTRSRFDGIWEVLRLQDGSVLLRDTNSRARLIRWDNPKNFRVLAEIPHVSSLYPWRGQGALTEGPDLRTVRQVMDGAAHPVLDVAAFLEPYLSFLREIEARSGQKLLKTIGKDLLIERPIFGGVSLPDKLALYFPMGGSGARVHLFDGSLGREIPLPACSGGPAAAPELIPAGNSLAFLIRYQCRGFSASGQNLQRRHFYYLPGSGSPQALSVLDRALDGQPILLAYLDERTAIWRPERGETWKILRDGQIRTLWPPKPSLD